MKLKRYISTLLSALILFANIGLVLNVHYCHGRVSSVSLSYKAKEHCSIPKQQHKKTCCAKAVKVEKKSCCKHNVLKIQDNTDKTIVKSLQLDLGVFYVSELYSNPAPARVAVNRVPQNAPAFYVETHAPPRYKLYCQYVFYA
ncbi:MAG: HYC_CC_PP family protein [Flavobacterium sp.]